MILSSKLIFYEIVENGCAEEHEHHMFALKLVINDQQEGILNEFLQTQRN